MNHVSLKLVRIVWKVFLFGLFVPLACRVNKSSICVEKIKYFFVVDQTQEDIFKNKFTSNAVLRRNERAGTLLFY